MWKELQKGWIPPKNITREDYINIKNNKDIKPQLAGFVGFGSSFGGKWFGGYVEYRGKNYEYCLSAYNSVLRKLKHLGDVIFYNLDYKDVSIPNGSLVYCDIPYRNTTGYCKEEVGAFNHNDFYQWVKDNSDKYDIYISEYKHNVPSEFEIVWELESKQSLRNYENKKSKTTEVIIKYKKE